MVEQAMPLLGALEYRGKLAASPLLGEQMVVLRFTLLGMGKQSRECSDQGAQPRGISVYEELLALGVQLECQ